MTLKLFLLGTPKMKPGGSYRRELLRNGAIISVTMGTTGCLRTAGMGGEPTPNEKQNESTPHATKKLALDFENGELGPWETVDMPERGTERNGNNWTVSEENVISGNRSAKLDTAGQWDDNCLVTEEFLLDMESDFDISFAWQTYSPNNCGPLVTQITEEGSDFQDAERGAPRLDDGIWLRFGPDAVNEVGSPFNGRAGFCGTEIEQPSFALGKGHTTTIQKRGGKAILTINGTEFAKEAVTTSGNSRLLLASEGTWGQATTIYFDDIYVTEPKSSEALS